MVIITAEVIRLCDALMSRTVVIENKHDCKNVLVQYLTFNIGTTETSKQIRAIIPVHVFGNACSIKKIVN